MSRLKQAVVAINRLRPRFVVVSGDLSHAVPGEPMYEAQAEAFRKTIARVSDSIPLLFLPGNHDIGNVPTVASLDAYRQRFGADYYGFWFGGLRCIVLNSTLMLRPDALPVEARGQDEWFAEEIELAKLGAAHVLIFTHHPWFVDSVDEEDSYWYVSLHLRLLSLFLFLLLSLLLFFVSSPLLFFLPLPSLLPSPLPCYSLNNKKQQPKTNNGVSLRVAP